MDARLHCVDLDTAYNQGAKKLERALVVRFFPCWRISSQLNAFSVNKGASELSEGRSDIIPSSARGAEEEHGH